MQSGGVSLDAGPPHQVVIASGGVSPVGVIMPTGCAWTATSNAPWITVNSGSPGNGNGAVAYTVGANAGPNPRRGTMTIASKPFIVSQKTPVPAPCTISASGPGSPIANTGGVGSVTITASTGSCAWSARSHVPWITLTPPTTGIGGGSVGFTVLPNGGGLRKGRITVNGKRVTISQN